MIRNAPVAIVLMCAALLAAACSPSRTMSATQLDALQTREIEAPMERGFAAASNALIDAGYLIAVSDADLGVLTAHRREDPAVAANVATIVATTIVTLGHAPMDLPPTFHGLCLQVMPLGSHRSQVRVRSFENVQATEDPVVVGQIWTLMQRQVLMK